MTQTPNRQTCLRRLARWSLFCSLIACFICQVNANTAEIQMKTVYFDVPEGKAIRTLKEVARQADVDIVFAGRLLRKVETPAVQGEYVPQEVFDLMLAGTSLAVFQHEKSGVYTIRKAAIAEDANGDPNPVNTTPMNKKKKTIGSLFKGLLSLAFASSTNLSAQNDSDGEEEIFELSPFTVNSSEDSGYRATSTLAGSRLNTSLEDVAATVTAITKEFMEDVGATDVGDLLIYTAGTEVSGTRGNYTAGTVASQGVANDIDNVRNSGGQGNRIRGLASADISRNFFQTSIGFDSYNTDRVDINRGSNAVLFGLGSPAGIINNTTQQAAFADSNRLRFQVDSFGRLRGQFNVNRVIVDDVFAVRVAGLRDERRFEQDAAYKNTDRVYFAASFQKDLLGKGNGLWGKTIINASYEDGNTDSNNPRTTPPQDLITPWFQPYTTGVLGTVDLAVKPAWDAHLARLTGSGDIGKYEVSGPVNPSTATLENPALSIGQSNTWHTAVALMFEGEDHLLPSYAGSGSLLGAPGRIWNWPEGVLNGDPPLTRTGTQEFPFNAVPQSLPSALNAWTGTVANPGPVGGSTLWTNPVVMDRSLFDFRKILIDGPNKSEGEDFDVKNLSLQQLFFGGKAGVELAWADERHSRTWDGVIGTRASLTLDINKVLFDGTENPNFGRPMVFGGSSSSSYRETTRESQRATAFVDLDFRKRDGWSKWFGRHVVTGLVSEYEEETYGYSSARAWDTSLSHQYTGSELEPDRWGELNAVTLHYLGDSLADMNSPAGANIPGIQVNQLPSVAKVAGGKYGFIS